MIWENELTRALNVSYPIIQAPMLGVTTVEMVAAISNNGGLGSLPVGGLTPEKTIELIRQVKSLTSRPFAVNLFANDIPEFNYQEIADMTAYLKELCIKHKLEAAIPSPDSFKFYSYREQVEILLREDIRIVSFTFGLLDEVSVTALKDKGVILIGTATSVKEAKLLDSSGIDMVTAQGIEAGGHRGSFLIDEPLPLVGAMALIPQIAENIKRPVIAAGAINDKHTVRAAMALGALGVQIGTAFIACDESMGIPAYKEAVQHAADTDSVLTNAYTGRWARGIRNTFITAFENAPIKIPDYPIQGALIGMIRMTALQENDAAFANLWAGQSCAKAKPGPAAEILSGLIKSVEAMSNDGAALYR